MLSHGYLPQVVEVELWTLARKRWTFYLANKTCRQQVYLSCCLTLLTTAVSHEVKGSNYRCRNFNHQTYYIQYIVLIKITFDSADLYCHYVKYIIQIFLRKYIWQSTSFQKVVTLNIVTSLTVNSIMDIFLQISQNIQNTTVF